VTRNIDLKHIEAAINPVTRALLPVDLAGLPVDRSALYAIARKHNLRVLEDAAQSMGAHCNGKRVGAQGDLVSISFHPNKNITTIEGGCLVLNDELRSRGALELGLQLPIEDFANSNWHMFQVVLPEERLSVTRAQVMQQLDAARIGSGAHYPVIHLLALYRKLGFRPGDYPIAEYVGRNILTLPLFPAMRDEDVTRVTQALMQILRSAAR
jgi:dTDP-4-amino-4,6-dideoxygalactose transaminase